MNSDFVLQPIFKWLNHKRPLDQIPLSDFDKICDTLKPCDVLLIEGRSRVSEVIKLITQSSWSHAALYIGRISEISNPKLQRLVKQYYQGDENEQLIIESELGLGTLIRPISVYKNEHIRICRPKGLKPEDALDVIRYSVSCIGYQYNVRQILDLARLLFPWHFLPRQWRSSIFNHNVGDPTKTICSTMIAEAFNFVQFPILPLVQKDEHDGIALYRRNPKLSVPRDFDYSPYFEIIKYPFIDYGKNNDYHQLPWRGDFDSVLKDLDVNIMQQQKNTPKAKAK